MVKYFIIVSLLLSIFSAGIKFIYDKFNSLNYELTILKAKNKKLISKQKDTYKKNKSNKKKMREHRKALISKKLKRAKLKLAKAPASMLPFAGATAIVAFTVNDLHNYCQDIKEFKKVEALIFGPLDNEISEDEKVLCGFDVKKELLPAIKSYSKDSTNWIIEEYNIIIDDTNKKIDELF